MVPGSSQPPASIVPPSSTTVDTGLALSPNAQIFLGNSGYQDAMLALLSEAITRGVPFRVCFLTNDTVNWLLDDEAYWEKWQSLLQHSKIAVTSFQLIYHQSHNIVKGRSYTRAWAPLKSLPNFQIHHLAIRQDTHRMFSETMMIIPHVGACFGIKLNHSQNRYIALVKDENILTRMEQDFSFLLSRCISTFESMEMDYSQIVAKFSLDSTLNTCHDVEVYLEKLPILTLPVQTLERMLARAGLPENKITSYLTAHKTAQHLLRNYLDQQKHIELLTFISPDMTLGDLVNSSLRHSTLYFDRDLVYTEEDAREHLEATLSMVQNERYFHLYVIEYSCYPTDLFIAYNGFLMEFDCNNPHRLNFSYQQNYLNDVLSYISSFLRQKNHERYTREQSIIRLEKMKGETE